MNYSTGSGADMLCMQCGRPVVGMQVWGASGPYHPECVKPPQPDTVAWPSSLPIGIYPQQPMVLEFKLSKEVEEKLDRIIQLLEGKKQ